MSGVEVKSTVVPDSIEPVIGWRAMALNGDRLHSPSVGAAWPFKQALRASCGASSQLFGYWRWTQAFDRFTTDEEIERIEALPHNVQTTAVTAASSSSGIFFGQTPARTILPKRPSIILVRGQWVLEWYVPEHHSPDENCNCGIYMAKDIGGALRYLRGPAMALVRTAGWGKVVPADFGYRVEFAYPQEIYLIGATSEHAKLVEERYGVPTVSAPSQQALLRYLNDPRQPLEEEKRSPRQQRDPKAIPSIPSRPKQRYSPQAMSVMIAMGMLTALNLSLAAMAGTWLINGPAALAPFAALVFAFIRGKR